MVPGQSPGREAVVHQSETITPIGANSLKRTASPCGTWYHSITSNRGYIAPAKEPIHSLKHQRIIDAANNRSREVRRSRGSCRSIQRKCDLAGANNEQQCFQTLCAPASIIHHHRFQTFYRTKTSGCNGCVVLIVLVSLVVWVWSG